MTEEEVKREFEWWSNNYDIRVERFKRIATLNAPKPIIDNEMRLIAEAARMLAVYGRPYLEVLEAIPELQGEKMIKDAFESEEIEKYEEDNEKAWDDFQKSMMKSLTDNLPEEHMLVARKVIRDLISELKTRTTFL